MRRFIIFKIIVSYLTGKDLATQKDEQVYSYLGEASGVDDFKLYPLGNISPNSEVNIQIMRTFTKLREMIESNKDLRRKIEEIKQAFALLFSW